VSRLPALALLLVGLAYPFAVYYGSGHLSPRFFAWLLGGLWLARLLAQGTHGNRWIALAALVFCVLLGVLNNPMLLHWYPVLISVALLLIFGLSLRYGMPIIERIARLQEPDLPSHAVRYTRQVTQVWTLFFLFNGSIAAALTLWAPRTWWLLYTGLIAYLLMGVLFTVEFIVRQRVRKHA